MADQDDDRTAADSEETAANGDETKGPAKHGGKEIGTARRWILLVAVLGMVSVIGGTRLLGRAAGDDSGGGCGGDTEPNEATASDSQALTSNDCMIRGEQWNLYGETAGGFCCSVPSVNEACSAEVCALDPARTQGVALCHPPPECVVHGEQWNLYGAEVGGFCCSVPSVDGSCSGEVCALDPEQSQGIALCHPLGPVASDCLVDGDQWNLYGASVGGFCCEDEVIDESCGGHVCALDPNRRQGAALCNCPHGWTPYGDADCCEGTVTGDACDTATVGGVCTLDDTTSEWSMCGECPQGWIRQHDTCCLGEVHDGVCLGRAPRIYSAVGADSDFPKAAASCPRGLLAAKNGECCDGTLTSDGACVPKHPATPLVCALDADDPQGNSRCCPAGTARYGNYCCQGRLSEDGDNCLAAAGDPGSPSICHLGPNDPQGFPECSDYATKACPAGMELYGGKYCCAGNVSADGAQCLPQATCNLSDSSCRDCPGGWTRYGVTTTSAGPFCSSGAIDTAYAGEQPVSGATACTLNPSGNDVHCDVCPVGTHGYGPDKAYCCDGVVVDGTCKAHPQVRCALSPGHNPDNLPLCTTTGCPQGWMGYVGDGGGFCCKGGCAPLAPEEVGTPICALDPHQTFGYPVCRKCPAGWTRYGDEAGGFCCNGAVSEDGTTCQTVEQPACTLSPVASLPTMFGPGVPICHGCQVDWADWPNLNSQCDECPDGWLRYSRSDPGASPPHDETDKFCCANPVIDGTCSVLERAVQAGWISMGPPLAPANALPPVCALDPERSQGLRLCNDCPDGFTRYGDWGGGTCCNGSLGAGGDTCQGGVFIGLAPSQNRNLQRPCPTGWRRSGDALTATCCQLDAAGQACVAGSTCSLNPSASQRTCAECPLGWTRYGDAVGGFCCNGLAVDGVCLGNQVCSLSNHENERSGNPTCGEICGYDMARTLTRPSCRPPPPAQEVYTPAELSQSNIDSVDVCATFVSQQDEFGQLLLNVVSGSSCSAPDWEAAASAATLPLEEAWRSTETFRNGVGRLKWDGGCSALVNSIPMNVNVEWMDEDCLNATVRGMICPIPDQIFALQQLIASGQLPPLSVHETSPPCSTLFAGDPLARVSCGMALDISQQVAEAGGMLQCLGPMFENMGLQTTGQGKFVLPSEACYEIGTLLNIGIMSLGLPKGKPNVGPKGKRRTQFDAIIAYLSKPCEKTPLNNGAKAMCMLSRLLRVGKYLKGAAASENLVAEMALQNCGAADLCVFGKEPDGTCTPPPQNLP